MHVAERSASAMHVSEDTFMRMCVKTKGSQGRSRRTLARCDWIWVVALALTPVALCAQINVVTNRYDRQRTGANLNETTLTVANVNASRFGKLYSYPSMGSVQRSLCMYRA